MNDKEIRRIMINYLKAGGEHIRIYQEKSIGGAACDLMAVTDHLTGYEIKSDLDNYARLTVQVKKYMDFFDRNYIVVGKSHEESVQEKVPDAWGIIVITEDNVQVRRPAKENKYVNLKSQLSVLWKLELRNLLTYFRLPLFADKNKDYISDMIVESVPRDQLGKQIAYELLHRDYSVYDTVDYTELVEPDNTEVDNIKSLVDNISEMDQLTLDQWIKIYNTAQKVREVKEEQARINTARPGHDITFEDIEVSPGAPWISKRMITEFIRHLLTMDGNDYTVKTVERAEANYEPITGNWFIEGKSLGDYSINCTVTYGLKNYNALHILEATLNLREIKLYKKAFGGGYDEESTLAALEKQKMLIDLFKKWIWEDEDRKWEIEENYNNLFSKYKKERFNGRGLKFPDMAPVHKLYDYQKDAVQRIIKRKNTLLAFDVGAGKTFIMIAAAMLMRQQGISRKNMFVVPNNIVGQWVKIFTDLYPNAQLLVIEPKSFKAPVRDKVMEQMKCGDYDGIIIAYSCFEMIPISVEYITKQMQEKLSQIDSVIKKIGYEVGSKSALESRRNLIRKLSNELILSMDYKSFTTTFDELEITTLFLDEAHNYKNLPINTKMKRLRGINVTGSKKCLAMLEKVRVVQNSDRGKGVVFATGTPLCNSLSDAYIMQMYLQYEDLCERNLDVFDNWVKTFARLEKVAEVDVDSRHYRYVTKFSKFFNLPELSRMFSDIAVFYAMDNEEGLPEMEEYDECVIRKNDALSSYMLTLSERIEQIRSGKIPKEFDNMLKVSTDGRKAALDLRLVGDQQPVDTSKVHKCVANVKDIYDRYEQCAQLVFCDYSTPKKDDFNIYSEIKLLLTGRGVPENEIAFIHNYNTEERKLSLYKKVNEGKVRVLIGSTFKLGIGANVQTRLKAVHHLDVPWRPADMVQREGRIIRRGNIYKDVFIYRYICEGSFDAYSWQILESKQKFITQFLKGSAYQRTASDLEENVLTYAEVKALAISDPRMKVLAEKENELANVRIVSNKYSETKRDLGEDKENLVDAMVKLEKQIKGTAENCNDIKGYGEKDYKELRKVLSLFLLPERINSEGKKLGSAWGFEFITPVIQSGKKLSFCVMRKGAVYTIEDGGSASGNAQRVSNLFKGLEKHLADLKQKLEENKAHLEQIKEELKRDNPYIEQVKKLEREVGELKEQIAEISYLSNEGKS